MKLLFLYAVSCVAFLCPLALATRRSPKHRLHSSTIVGNVQQVNPEAKLNASQIIAYRGYRAEEYRVQTEDGYLLYIQRIPCEHGQTQCTAGRPVVVLQHGLEGCSTNFLANSREESLAYILADAGYDVWLGNARGNFYGRAHIKFSVDSSDFWDFSFDEIAAYDLPAIIDKALDVSGQEQVSFVGHSEGTLVGFALFSVDVDYSKKVNLFIALAPVAYLGNVKSLPFRALAPFAYEIDFLAVLLGDHELLPGPFINHIGAKFCTGEIFPAEVCANILYIIAGYDAAQLNNSRLDVYIAHNPSGTSTQNIFHFAQLVDTDKCQFFDYGSKKKNMQRYGQSTPPQYPLEQIQVPTVLMYADADILATETDVLRLQKGLTSVVESYKVPYKPWTHLDFIFGIDANYYVYPEVLTVLRKYAN